MRIYMSQQFLFVTKSYFSLIMLKINITRTSTYEKEQKLLCGSNKFILFIAAYLTTDSPLVCPADFL